MIDSKIYVKSKTTLKNFSKDAQVNEGMPFNWEEFERTSKSGLIENTNIKTTGSDIVFSHDIYAQEAYYMYTQDLDSKCFIPPVKGTTIEAEIISINKDTAILDVNYREYIYLELRKESKRYREDIIPGKKILVKILNNKDSNNAIYASYTDAIQAAKELEIRQSIGKAVAFKSRVKELIKGGFMVDIDGIECFMPGSQVTVNKIDNFEDYVGEELIVMPINYSPEKGTIVVSAREFLKTLIPSRLKYVKDNIKEKYHGIVTGTTKFGVFCEFQQCLTGLIYVSDLDKKTFNEHKNRRIKPNDYIEFFIKDITDDGRIILTQVPKNDPWDNIDEKYKVQSVVTATVISIKDYGAFIELEKGLSCLIHYSEYEGLQLEEGDKIKVKIIKIDKENKKINVTLSK